MWMHTYWKCVSSRGRLTRLENDRFFKFYIDLLTRPVPVKFQ